MEGGLCARSGVLIKANIGSLSTQLEVISWAVDKAGARSNLRH